MGGLFAPISKKNKKNKSNKSATIKFETVNLSTNVKTSMARPGALNAPMTLDDLFGDIHNRGNNGSISPVQPQQNQQQVRNGGILGNSRSIPNLPLQTQVENRQLNLPSAKSNQNDGKLMENISNLSVKGCVLMVSIFDYVPINPDELAVNAYDKVQVTETSLNEMSEFVWATKVGSRVGGHIPRMLLRKDGTNEALLGFVKWTRQEAERNIQPNTFIIRPASGKYQNQPFSVTIWKPGFEKCTHQQVMQVEQNGQIYYQVHSSIVDNIKQLIDSLTGTTNGQMKPLTCEPPVPPLRGISVAEAGRLKTKNLGEGNFGEVYMAVKMRADGSEVKFAVKKLKIKSDEANSADALKYKKEMEEETQIMQYIAYMKNTLDCHTETLVRLLSAPEGSEVVFIELCPLGDAKKLIDTILSDNCGVMPISEILKFATQMMEACEFLTRIRVSHNDWACRNILVISGGNRCKYLYKVSDFGLTTYVRDGNEQNDQRISDLTRKLKHFSDLMGARLPFRWMPPEITSQGLQDCDENCNMWSCCVTIMEFGSGVIKIPWGVFNNSEFRNFLKTLHHDPRDCEEYEYRPKPQFMNDKLFSIIKKGIKHKIYRAKPAVILNELATYD